jgi:hypothetical protein
MTVPPVDSRPMTLRVDDGLKAIADSVWEIGRFVPCPLHQISQPRGHACEYEAAAVIGAVNSIARMLRPTRLLNIARKS